MREIGIESTVEREGLFRAIQGTIGLSVVSNGLAGQPGDQLVHISYPLHGAKVFPVAKNVL